MNIWIMNHYATSMYYDRAGRHYWFAEKLNQRGYKTTVFCATTLLNSDKQIDTKGKFLSVKRAGTISFVFVKTDLCSGNGIGRIKNMMLFYKNLFPAAKAYECKYGKPDVIIASSVHPLTMVAGIQIARIMRVPCICEIRDLWPEAIFSFGKAKENSFMGKMLVWGEHWIYRHADALVFTKEGDTDYLKEKKWNTEQGGDIDLTKCFYINNGVDTKAFERNVKETVLEDPDLWDDTKFNVTYAGTIRSVNHVETILDAARILLEKPEYEDIRILIYGDGEEKAKLVKRVEEERITNVRLKGFVERRYVPFILSKSSVNILNYSQSQYNWTRGNSSNKLFEYMASGKPVISTVRTGYSIIRRYDCGEELEEDNPAALARQIIEFHDMDSKKYEAMCRNAKEGVKDFDFEVLTNKLEKVIESVT